MLTDKKIFFTCGVGRGQSASVLLALGAAIRTQQCQTLPALGVLWEYCFLLPVAVSRWLWTVPLLALAWASKA
jgi:hypothetical protein